MPSNHKRNTEGIRAFARRKSIEKTKKVDEAIHNLVKKKEAINFNSVSVSAGVTKSFLYNNPELRTRIEDLRKQQEGLPSPKEQKRDVTDAGKDVIIAAQSKRIKDLELENKQLKTELEKLRGIMYESL